MGFVRTYVLDLWVRAADDPGVSLVLIAVAGVGIGFAFGLFGAGGSAFGTPILALLGVPAPIAIASPLPAVLPAALDGRARVLPGRCARPAHRGARGRGRCPDGAARRGVRPAS